MIVKDKVFTESDFLGQLERGVDQPPTFPLSVVDTASTPPALTEAGVWLVQLLKARAACIQAANDTELAADELRRYQKFARPGQPSAHIVQLRQRQAAARQASARARQAFLKAALEFVRVAGLVLPPKMALDAFVTAWIDTHVPKDVD